MKVNRAHYRILQFILNLLVWIFSFTCIFPFLWVLYSSLKTPQEFSLNIMALPAKPSFLNYLDLIKNNRMYVAFLNSAYISGISVLLILFIGFVTAYCLARFEFKGRKFLAFLFLSGMLIPVHSLLVPLFIFFKKIGLYNTRFALIIPYVALGLPMTVFLVESFIKTIPLEVEEAALIDGCSLAQRLLFIVWPLCRPVISTTLILSFLSCWNEFPFALILIARSNLKTLPLWLTNFNGQFSTNYTQLMAGLVVASLPVILVYLIFSKLVVKGMTAGAVKG